LAAGNIIIIKIVNYIAIKSNFSQLRCRAVYAAGGISLAQTHESWLLKDAKR
jgi:hypothetical protein